MDTYLYLSSSDSSSIHTSNIWYDFTVELPQPINLKGIWECALVEFQITTSTRGDQAFCVCTNICQESCVGEAQLPILRRLSWVEKKKEAGFDFPRPHYLGVKLSTLKRIRVYITGLQGSVKADKSGQVTCTLHLRRTR